GGVTVTAYNPDGDQVGQTKTTFTAASGSSNYKLDVDVDPDTPLRIEFTDLPEGMYETFNAGQSDVQFTTAGSSDKVNFGAFDPDLYNPVVVGEDANPTLASAILSAGDRTHSSVADLPAIVGNLWNVTENVSGRDGRYGGDWPGGEDTQTVPS